MGGGKHDEQAHPSNEYDRPSNRCDHVQEGETDHINIEMLPREDQELQQLSPNGNARGQEETPEPRSCFKKQKTKIAFGIGIGIGIGIVFLIIFLAFHFSSTTENQKTQAVQTGTSVPLNSQKDAMKVLLLTCQPDWIGYGGSCYKLSEVEKNWTESQNSCLLHNATLAKITEEEIMSNGIMRMFTKVHAFWIGLTRDANQQWKWPDGENATMEVKGNEGDCAYLDDELKAMSVRCSIEIYYLCKTMLPRDPCTGTVD